MSRVLVIDDDESIVEVIRVILTEYGHDVVAVTEGSKIDYLLKHYSPDLILLDVLMYGMNGPEIVKTIKANSSTSKIPIVMISALDDIKKIAKEVKADGYLGKPFDINDLIKIVAQFAD